MKVYNRFQVAKASNVRAIVCIQTILVSYSPMQYTVKWFKFRTCILD